MLGAFKLDGNLGPNQQLPEGVVVGDAVGTSADVAKFGSRSYKAWNGTGNSTTYFSLTPSPVSTWVPVNAAQKISPAFTAEFWIYVTAAPTTTVNIWQRLSFSTEWRFLMQANLIPQMRYRYYNPYPGTITDRVISGNQYATLNTWNHLAYVQNANTIYFFMNGQLCGSFTETDGIIESGNSDTGWAVGEGAASGMRYYIDELRVSDVARYTSAFTPSSSAFSYDKNTIALLHFEETAGSKRFYGSVV